MFLKKDSSLNAYSFSGNDRIKRSTHERTTRDTNTSSYKYLEAALIVPKSYEEKYGPKKFQNVLLVIANMVCIRMRVWTFADVNTPVSLEELQSLCQQSLLTRTFEPSSTHSSVSKLCFHLGLVAAVGEVRFMIGISFLIGLIVSRRQRARVVRTSELTSRGRGFKSRSDY